MADRVNVTLAAPGPALTSWFDRLGTWMNAIAAGWIGVIMGVAVADVLVREISVPIGRHFGLDVSGIQIHGTHEIVRWSIVGIVFLQLPASLRAGRHIRSIYLLGKMAPLVARALDATAHVIGAVIFSLIAWASWPNLVRSWRMLEWEGEGAIRFPVYPMRTILFVGSIVLAIAFLVEVRRLGLAIRAGLPGTGDAQPRPPG